MHWSNNEILILLHELRRHGSQGETERIHIWLQTEAPDTQQLWTWFSGSHSVSGSSWVSCRSVILDCHWLTQIILTSDWLIADRTSWTDSDREVSQLTSDPIEESEVLSSLDQDYYKQDWDSSTHWLTLLGDDAKDLDTIDKARKDLIKQLTTVSRRVFSLILSKQTDCARQLDHIVRVEKQLKAGLSVCQVK